MPKGAYKHKPLGKWSDERRKRHSIRQTGKTHPHKGHPISEKVLLYFKEHPGSGMTGKVHSEASKVIMRRKRLGKSCPHVGVKQSDSTRTKKRIATLNHVLKCGHRTGRNEAELLDTKSNEIQIPIVRQYHIKELGYVVDGICFLNNTVYEVYEKFHMKRTEHDKYRQSAIQEYLGCNFVIIWDNLW